MFAHITRVVLAALVVSACTDLDEIPRGECGNGVIEPAEGEDCDGGESCGQPGTAQACRLLCAATADCPGAAACGLDGVCHAPGGSFDLARSVAWTAPYLIVGDATGDGYPELIGVGAQQVEVRLGGADLSLSALPPIASPPLFGAPAAADLEGDGDLDVVLPVGAGLFTLGGDPATALEPFFYSSFDAPAEGRIVAAPVVFAELIRIPVIAARDTASGASLVAFIGDGPAGFAPFPPGRTVDEVVGDVLPVGQLVVGSLDARVIALPLATGRTIPLYDATLVGLSTPTMTVRAPVTLPLGTEVRRGAWFADFDGDGHVDLVVSVTTGTIEGLAVAWGRADGALVDSANVVNQATVVWRADRDQDGDGAIDGALEPVVVGQVTDNLLVLGDENDADVVARGGLYTTHCVIRSQCALYLLRRSTRDWTGAVIADLNADGRPDVAAFAQDQPGIDLLLNTATTLLFNDATIPTAGAVTQLVTGDFDGDTIVDLAYVDAVVGVPFSDVLSVAYGTARTPPTAPVRMGPVGEMVAFGAFLASSSNGQFDYIDDLIMVTDREVGGAARRGAAIAFGSSARRLFAPLLPQELPRGDRPIDATIVEAALALEGNGDAYRDLVVLTATAYGAGTAGENSPVLVRHARFFAGQADGQADEVRVLELTLGEVALVGARWLGADVTATATDEVVALLASGGLVVIRIDDGCAGPACVTVVAPPAAALSDPVAFSAADADGDGDLDLLAVMRNRSVGSTAGREAAVVVWWNDGGFTPGRTQLLTGALADAALVDLDRDGVSELVLLEHGRAGDAGGQVTVAHLAGGTYGPAAPVAAISDGVALRAGDLDGDRLADLVVVAGADRATPRELTVFLQTAARIPSGARGTP